jgi:hypothetical protein
VTEKLCTRKPKIFCALRSWRCCRPTTRGFGSGQDQKGLSLSPILLIQGDLATGIALQIANGYHRVCASYHTDENTDIPVILAPRN